MQVDWRLGSWTLGGDYTYSRTREHAFPRQALDWTIPAKTSLGTATPGLSTSGAVIGPRIDTIKESYTRDFRHVESGGSPLVGTGNAFGAYPFDSDALKNFAGSPANPADGYVATLGLRQECESAMQLIPGTAPASTYNFVYAEPCPVCYFSGNQAKSQPNGCLHLQLPPASLLAQAPAGSMRAPDARAPVDMASQWAFRKLGLPLTLPWDRLAPVTVAVIDTGLDYRNPNLKPENIWINPSPGSDRAHPGDVIGWNFVARHNNPVDDVGHGTFVSGLIVAVNPRAQILPIKALDAFGSGLDSAVGRAVVYAVRRGARVINLSVGRQGLTEVHQDVVDYARSRGVVVVVAAGNEGKSLADYTPGGVAGALVVASTDQNDRKPPFGNWGQNVSLAAPGVDIVSLRAAWTDFILVASGGKEYRPGENIVGPDGWHYRASGTSFSAPFVAGAASLLFSLYPNLTGRQVERMLVESADDVEIPGWDQFTGNGRLNIGRAVFADPNAHLTAKVARIQPGQRAGQPVIQVFGTADGNTLRRYRIELGRGESPTTWKTVASESGKAVEAGLLAEFPVREITARGAWRVRVMVEDARGRTREARGNLDVQ
jgi:hypothetical protein